jgi:DNA primase
MNRDRDRTDQIERARNVPIEHVVEERGIRLRGRIERVGACPHCGGDDRFGLNVKKQLWHCRGCQRGGDVIALVQHLDGVDFLGAVETLAGNWAGRGPARDQANGKGNDAIEETVAEFQYHNMDGEIAFVVERREYRNPDGSFVPGKKGDKRKKTFRQMRPDPDHPDNWIWNVENAPVVPYRLPEVSEAIANGHPIFVVEGEAKVDLLTSWNVPATCCAMGAGKWHDEHSHFLAGADVVILPDNDQNGRKHANQVAASLQGIAASVRVLDLPGLPEKGDIIDWAKAGGSVEKLHDLVEHQAKPWKGPSESTETPQAERKVTAGQREPIN